MRLAFVVNDIMTEQINYSTTHLALEAMRRGHEIWYVTLSDLAYDPDEQVHANARRPPGDAYATAREMLHDLQSENAVRQRIVVDEMDVLMLRNDPAEDFLSRPWARLAGINFGRLATLHGVIVLNDPDGLNHAVNKTYLQYFPKSVRPRSLITRSKEDIRSFADAEGGTIVIKPLAGSGGRNVFLIRPEDAPNFNQMIEAVLQEGYIIAQEYLPQAVEGDTRLLMMNGKILRHEGKFAAMRRRRLAGDMRSNMAAGGTREAADVTTTMINLAETVSRRLIADGIFLAGLDIVGDKIMEINVFSPGALYGASQEAGVNFMEPVIVSLERKVAHRNQQGAELSNAELAVF
jgi:glutathione synthase